MVNLEVMEIQNEKDYKITRINRKHDFINCFSYFLQSNIPGGKNSQNRDVDWGLGTGLERSDSRIGIWHWGDNTYAQAFYLAIPDQKIGIVYFANSFYGLALAKDIVNISRGREHPVMACGIMQPYISLVTPISTFIQKIKNKDFESAEDFFKKNILLQIGYEHGYDEALRLSCDSACLS